MIVKVQKHWIRIYRVWTFLSVETFGQFPVIFVVTKQLPFLDGKFGHLHQDMIFSELQPSGFMPKINQGTNTVLSQIKLNPEPHVKLHHKYMWSFNRSVVHRNMHLPANIALKSSYWLPITEVGIQYTAGGRRPNGCIPLPLNNFPQGLLKYFWFWFWFSLLLQGNGMQLHALVVS